MKFLFLTSLLFIQCQACAQPNEYATWDSEELILDNGYARRTISLKDGNISTTGLTTPGQPDNFMDKGSQDFLLSINDNAYSGISHTWTIENIKQYHDDQDGRGAVITLLPVSNASFRLNIIYVMYPELPVIRKWMKISNLSDREIKVESVDIENLKVQFDFDETIILNNYARNSHIGQQFEGDHYDPAVILHQMDTHRGLVIGNEAPGFCKRTTIYQDDYRLITAGLTHSDQQFPTRAWIKPGETWESTRTFIVPYVNTDKPFKVIDGPVNDFVRRHLGIRLAAVAEKPVFVYNTWEPFWHDIHEKMVMEIADAAAACGVEEFIIDDGWQSNYGDWGINKENFPMV